MNKLQGSSKLSGLIFHIALFFSLFAIGVLVVSQCFMPGRGEAYTGSSFYEDISDSWIYFAEGGTTQNVNLPCVIDVENNQKIVVERNLPDLIQDHLCLFIRSSRQNVRIFVDNELRSEYVTDNLSFFARNVPSAYVFAELCMEDSGKPVRVEIWGSSTFRGNIQSVAIAHASSAWNSLWKSYGIIVITNLILLLFGVIAVIICLILHWFAKIKTKILHLSYSLILFSLWAICENRLRQVIFPNASIVGVLVFVFMGMMVIPLFRYWNETQKGRYRVLYDIVNGALVVYMVVAGVLFLLNIRDIFDCIMVNYVLIFLGIILIIVTTAIDLSKGRLREYSFSIAGIGLVLLAGVIELILSRIRPFYAAGFLMSVSLILMLILSTVQGLKDLVSGYRERELHQSEMTLRTIRTVAGTIDAKDEYTGGHSVRVAEYASRLAAALGMSDEECRNIHYIGLMHDIGKIGVPDVILNKNGKLVQDEFSLMKLHTTIGCEIIGDIDSVNGLKDGVLYHHERYDGKGYPFGLKGEDIPLVARILCLADSYDAMTSNRVYRKRLNDDEVRREIIDCAGKQFDPALAEIFLGLLESGKIKPVSSDGFEKTGIDSGTNAAVALQKMIQGQNSYSGAYELTNPEFMRMIVYIIKLAERNRQPLIVRLFSIKNADGKSFEPEEKQAASDFLRLSIVNSIRSTDITTPYSTTKRLVVFMNTDSERGETAVDHIKEKFDEMNEDKKYILTSEEINLM